MYTWNLKNKKTWETIKKKNVKLLNGNKIQDGFKRMLLLSFKLYLTTLIKIGNLVLEFWLDTAAETSAKAESKIPVI
jgi:hypothetical protein